VTTFKVQLVVAVFAAAGVMSACSSAKTAAAPPACKPAHAAEFPTTDAALADGDAGGTFCVRVGETLTVALHVPPGDTGPPWQPIAPSDTSVLAPVSNGVVALPRGVTATFLSVRKPGVVTITARRGGPPLWKATVVARAK
jgi:hypothetical protein